MVFTSEEALDLETRLTSLLEQNSSLYPFASLPNLSLELSSFDFEEGRAKHAASVRFLLGMGLVLNHLYKLRIQCMSEMCDAWLAGTKGIPKEELAYPLNKDTLYDLRDYGRFVPSFDEPSKPQGEDLSEVVHQLVRTGLVPIFPGHTPQEIALQLIRLSYHFDQFAVKEQLSHRDVKRGDRLKQLDCYRVYSVLIDEFNHLMNPDQKPDSLEPFLEKVASTSSQIIEIGSRSIPDSVVSSSLAEELSQTILNQKDHLYARTLTIGINSDWRDNTLTRINPCCIYDYRSGDGLKSKKGNKACFSLLYSLDPAVHQLFFNVKDSEAQAVAILFEAEDAQDKPYLILEGVVANSEFLKLDFLKDRRLSVFNPSLYQRIPPLDLILYYSAQYACSLNRNMFLNMTEITGMEEYGPHDLLHYLPRLFSELSYHPSFMSDPRSSGEKNLAVSSSEGAEEIYLRKDNVRLLSKLREAGISLPSGLIDPHGKLKLMAHTWADPQDPETWINSCEGRAYGKILSVEELRKII